jgi:GR25 family glycosyltransferase involved in LPS biosynthesis
MLLLSDFTQIRVTRIPGVRGEDVLPKAKPNKAESLLPGVIGCWRAHADAWARVIDEGLETALILEDDADWDIALKEELSLLSNALAEQGSPLGNSKQYLVTAAAPYGV